MTLRVEPKRVVILGSTGSIGTSTLEVIAALPGRFTVVGLAASRNSDLLQQQIDRFKPRFAACGVNGHRLQRVTIVDGAQQLSRLAMLEEADIVVVATSGHDAIQPTIDALTAGKIVALANKESIVAAGEIVMRAARQGPGTLRPIDSEHSALWQCLKAGRSDGAEVRRLVLTASGGPFRGWSTEELRGVTPEQALRHPNWAMGSKITVDSATLMNKGLEIIEARWLFDVNIDDIDVVVHPQSLVHSCVEFVDGSIVAQIASHDMRLPIQYALTYPDRLAGPATKLSVLDISRLEFEPPDERTFPLLSIAREAGRLGSTYPAVLSESDSVAVDAFLDGELRFDQIADAVKSTLDCHSPHTVPLTVEGVVAASLWANAETKSVIARLAGRS
ncbi:MAG TPA: 1-deoxy-D-xylulose-5-phosphate reductoisomerase [Thermomicrobiales bacterium]|nr:1-deoxy-D-xylulose-5-phosphate reductoisomerase [Thermomicrobiales bacterium]